MAWYAMLRPGEYMLTPAHRTFDGHRHMRAGDIVLFADNKVIRHGSSKTATHMTINIKQSKTDSARLGATHATGATGCETCPVRHMQEYLRLARPPRHGPLFPGLRYTTMLRVLRVLIPNDPELYGLHSFRVGGAQALALGGRPFEYIMARGRWKTLESVIRYVETPLDIQTADARVMTDIPMHLQIADAAAMSLRTAPTAAPPRTVWGNNTH